MAFLLNRNVRVHPLDLFGFDLEQLKLADLIPSTKSILNINLTCPESQNASLELWKIHDNENGNEDIAETNDLSNKEFKDISIDFKELSHYVYTSSEAFEKERMGKNEAPLKNNHVLLKYPLNNDMDFEKLVFLVQALSYIPVVIFPYDAENFKYVIEQKKIIRLIRKGCRFQIDYLSLTGRDGTDKKKICDYLMQAEVVDFIGIAGQRWPELNESNRYSVSKSVAHILAKRIFAK